MISQFATPRHPGSGSENKSQTSDSNDASDNNVSSVSAAAASSFLLKFLSALSGLLSANGNEEMKFLALRCITEITM